MKIAIGSDHAGFQLKSTLIKYLTEKGYVILDQGVLVAERCDYPDYAMQVCDKVVAGEADWGLLVCGTGIGMSMAANKVRGIRAAVITDPFCAAATRQHNNANVLCVGERVIGVGVAYAIVDAWISAEFEGGRHANRVAKMMALEERS